MAIEMRVKKKLGEFTLDVDINTESSRLGILGASGCGKSMTLRCMAGVERPDWGTIAVDGRVLFDSKKRIDLLPRQRGVGFLFQNYALFPTMTVESNIAAGLNGSKAEKGHRTAEMIEAFRLRGLENHLPGQLSGGQQQRVALARIMAYRPEIILLDEPFSALDGHLRDDLQREVLETFRSFGGTVVTVSHNRDEIYKFSDALSVMESGHTVQTGPTRELFERPRNRVTARLTGCKNVSPAKKLGERRVLATDWGIELDTTQDVPDDIKFVGFRAFMIEGVDGPGENAFPVILREVIESPFEIQYILETETSGSARPIWWKKPNLSHLNASCGFTGYIRIPEDCVLILE